MRIKIKGIKEIAHKYKNFFFDLDGVMWWGNQSIPGSLETLNYLRKRDKNMYFVTNASIRCRKQLQARFQAFGFKTYLNQLYPSAYFTGLYLKQKYPSIKNVICFGNQFLAKQLRLAGLKVNHATDVIMDNQPLQILDKYYDPNIQAVVVGFDKFMTYSKICLASFHIQKGAKFFGTNPDKYSLVRGMKVPSAGSMLSLIEMASKISPQIPGKPNTFIIDHIIQKNNLDRNECVMIGDNLDTDIMFGNKSKISTCAVLSSVSTLSDIQNAQGDRIPNYFLDRIGAEFI